MGCKGSLLLVPKKRVSSKFYSSGASQNYGHYDKIGDIALYGEKEMSHNTMYIIKLITLETPSPQSTGFL